MSVISMITLLGILGMLIAMGYILYKIHGVLINVYHATEASNIRFTVIIDVLDGIRNDKENKMAEVYKDALDRVMSRDLGQYEAIKQHRESGEPLSEGGRATSKSENMKKIIERNRKIMEDK